MDFTNIRVVAVDIDGTLENSKHQITPRTEQAIKEVVRYGISVVIATGKTYPASQRVREQLCLQTPSVHSQGLLIYESDGSILYENHMEFAIIQEVLHIMKMNEVETVVYSQENILSTARNSWTCLVENYGEPQIKVVENLDDYQVQKIIALATPARLKSLRDQLTSELSGRAKVVQSNLGNMLEVLPLGASKGDGVRRVLEHLEFAPSQLLAIGDGENDIEMIKLASIGISMGNAEEMLKNSADFVTATNDEEGVAVILERLISAL